MGLFQKIKQAFGNNQDKTIAQFGSESISFAGIDGYSLTEQSLLRIPEFYSGMEMITNSIAQTEFIPMESEYRNDNTLKTFKNIQNSPWYKLLNKKPNEFIDKDTFWRQNMFNYFLRGGFYIWVLRDKLGKPTELYNIDPDLIKKVKVGDKFVYEFTVVDNSDIYSPTDILEIPYEDIISVTYGSLERVSDLQFKYVYGSLLKQLGLKNNFDSNQLNSAPRTLAHVKGKGKLNEEDRKVIKNSLSTFFQNAKTVDKSSVLVTDERYEVELLNKEGGKIQAAVDKDFVKMLMVKFANALHIPLPKLNILDTGSSQYKSREGIQIDYLQDAISPIVEKIISKLNEIIFSNDDKKEFQHSYTKLLKYDKATLGEYSVKMSGVLTTNELRHLNGFQPLAEHDNIIALNGNPVDISLVKEKTQAEIDQIKNNKPTRKGGKDE